MVTGNSSEFIVELVIGLGKEFAMKDLRPLHFFLGIEVRYFNGGIHLNQGKYAAEFLKKTGMALAKAVSALLAQKHGLQQATGAVDAFAYKSILGSL